MPAPARPCPTAGCWSPTGTSATRPIARRGRGRQPPSPPTAVRRPLGRGHDVVLGRPEVPGRRRRRGQGEVNARYGNDPGATFYTHVSDQYSPFHTKVINATSATPRHVLDGLLDHESDLRIEEHYTDTGGFHRSCLRPVPSPGLPIRAAHPRPGRQAARRHREADLLSGVGGPGRHRANTRQITDPLGRDPSPGDLDPAGHRHGALMLSQARGLSPPERTGVGACGNWAGSNARCSPCTT